MASFVSRSVCAAKVPQPGGNQRLTRQNRAHTVQGGDDLRRRLQIRRIGDVDMGDLVVGDRERAGGHRVEVLHAVLGVDIQQPVLA